MRVSCATSSSVAATPTELVDAFFAVGWTKENLVDAIVVIGDKTVTNYLHGSTKVPVYLPAAPALKIGTLAAK